MSRGIFAIPVVWLGFNWDEGELLQGLWVNLGLWMNNSETLVNWTLSQWGYSKVHCSISQIPINNCLLPSTYWDSFFQVADVPICCPCLPAA